MLARAATTSVCALIAAVALNAQPADRATDVCKVTAAPRVSDFVIDAVTLDRTPKTRFNKHDHVRVIITNQNPFRYEYKVTISETAVTEPAIAAFLQLIGGPVAEVLPKPPTTKEAGAAAPNLTGCNSDAQGALSSLTKSRLDVTREMTSVSAAYDQAQRAQATVKARIDSDTTKLRDSGARCLDLVETAAPLRDALQAFAQSLDALSSESAAGAQVANAQLQRISEFEEKFSGCRPQILADMRTEATTLAGYSSRLEPLQKVRQDTQSVNAKLAAFLAQPNYIRNIGDYDTSTEVTVKVERKDIVTGGDFGEVTVQKLHFGGGVRFALGGGVSFSPLRKIEYQRIQGFELDRNGNIVKDASGKESFTSVVGLTQDSSTRISPLVMLHGDLHDFTGPAISMNASLGVTAKSDNKGTDVEFLLGPSWGFLDNKLFVTTGAYIGKQQVLIGNLYVGAALPKDLAEIPVRKDYHWQFGIAVTYKIK